MKKLIRKQEENIKQHNDKRIKEINRKKELYLEERNLLQQEPEYFTEEDTKFTDLASILTNDYNNDENVTELHDDENLEDKMHEDYPEFPAIENDEDYDYSKFENITIHGPA